MTDIAIVCGLGGHYAGMKLLDNAYMSYDHFYIICKGTFTLNTKIGKRYILNNPIPSNHKKFSLISYLKTQIIISVKIFQILIREKPKIIMSTGPSLLTIPTFYFGKFIGAKTIFIENIARFNPSISGRMVYPIVNKLFVRTHQLLKKYGQKAELYDNYNNNGNRNIISRNKKNIIFVTTGSSNYPYNRLIKKMDNIAPKLPLPVIMQIGNIMYKPKNTMFFSFCESNELKKYYERADIVVGHAGGGTFLDMVKFGVRGIMLPRIKKYGEAAHNHQQEQTNLFQEMGITIAKNEQDLEDLLLHRRDDILPITLNLENGDRRLIYVIRKYIDNVLKTG